MSDIKKLVISLFAMTFFTLGLLTLLYLVYGRYIQNKCAAPVDRLMTQSYAGGVLLPEGLTVISTDSATIAGEVVVTPLATPEATATPTKMIYFVPPTPTDTPTP